MNGVWLGNSQISVELSTRTVEIITSKQCFTGLIISNDVTHLGGIHLKKNIPSASCSEGHLDLLHMPNNLK